MLPANESRGRAGKVPAIVLGTGPSLTASAASVRRLSESGVLLFGINNTFRDFDLDVWIACDPAWHEHYGTITGHFDRWHWDRSICARHGYMYVEGVWLVDGIAYPRSEYVTPPGPCGGLWLKDKTRISLNHCSSAQALNLAANQYGCDPCLLVGHDFHYGPRRHYFDDLSDVPGEYPKPLRKRSLFDKRGNGDDLLQVYRRIADQDGRPEIINCTPGSQLPWFPMGNLDDF